MGGAALREEVVGLARELIRIDTSSPPGAETAAARHLAAHLEGAGVECELAGPDPERLNLVARIEGDGGPSLMLMGHTDVVPAPAANWTVPPFEGVVRDGRLFGRGAVDMKGEVAARAVALAAFARSGRRPAGDVVLVAESDEERNVSDVGMSWLVRERPDLRCDYALNEGGGLALELAGGRRIVIVSVGEKLVSSLRVRVRGTAAHASVPSRGDNPLEHAATAIRRLLAHRAQGRVPSSLAGALDSLGAPLDPDRAVAWAEGEHPILGALMPALTRMTVTPTGLRTTEPANVIPPFADVICDCRALPGQGPEEVREHVAAALGGEVTYELDFLEPLVGGTESPVGTPLFEACASFVAERLPGAELFPVITPGFTDSHWVRREHGTVAYGFAPVFHTDPIAYSDAAHGADEAIATADLVEMAEFHLHAIESLTP
ncbi:MAG: M20/M25/M40 family metallo-hydrolase [Solirubrobacterales bacterium]